MKKNNPKTLPQYTSINDEPIITTKQQKIYEKRTDYLNVVLMSFSLMLIFIGYNAAQGFYTTLHKIGGFVLGELYIVYAVLTIFSPFFSTTIGSKLTLILGSFFYVVFVICSGVDFSPILYVSGFIEGIGASMLWTSQGDILVLSSTRKTIGTCTSIFFVFFQFSNLFGFFSIGLLKIFHISNLFIFIILGWVSTIGVMILFLIRNDKYLQEKNPEGFKKRSLKQILLSFADAMVLMFDLKMIFLNVNFLYCGYAYAFYFGSLTKAVGEPLISWVMIGFASSGIIGTLVTGRFGDKVSRRYMMLFTLLINFLSILLTFTIHYHISFTFIAVICCGFSNMALQTSIYSFLGVYFSRDPPPAIALSKFFQSISSSLQLLTGTFLSFFEIQCILMVVLCVVLANFLICELFIAPIDKYKFKSHNIFRLLCGSKNEKGRS